MGNIEKACAAAASFLMFFPEDETMLENKIFYLSLENVTESMFTPRPEALQYYERELGEKALLQFIEDNFHFDEGEISEPTVPELTAAGPDVVESDTTVMSNEIVQEENEIPNST